MIICIDESGTHMQIGKSVIALVYVKTQDVPALDLLVLRAEEKSGISGFHWAHRNWQMREDFIQMIVRGSFVIKIAYLSNPISLGQGLEDALGFLLVERNIGMLLIDGDKSKKDILRLKKVLRDKGIKIRKIRAVNDEAYPAVRIADAVAGAVRYYTDQPNSRARVLYELLQSKIELEIDLKKIPPP